MITKRILDTEVARRLSMPPRAISLITAELAQVIVKTLVEGITVRYDGLGTLRPCRYNVYRLVQLQGGRTKKGGRSGKRRVVVRQQLRVCFSKSSVLKKELSMTNQRDEGMDKYGVDETAAISQEALEKRAAKGCPECGKPLTKHGSVLICPKHGTEPFEKG